MLNVRSRRRRLTAGLAWFAIMLVLVTGVPARAPVAAQGMSPQALNKPIDVACQPVENSVDKVEIIWKDQSDDETNYLIERQVESGDWFQISSIGSDSTKYSDSGLDPAKVYRYRVISYRSSDNAFGDASDVCRKPSNFDTANFRIYYRTQDCPIFEGSQVCVPDISDINGNNETAARIANISEGSRAAMLRVGFDDLAFYKGGKPLPINLFRCGGLLGCANTGGFGNGRATYTALDPGALGAYNPSTDDGTVSILVTLHELFHNQQYAYGGIQTDPDGGWVWEGQATTIEDKFCVGLDRNTCISLDDIPDAYIGEVNNYLSNADRGIPNLSYTAALFWTYVTERYGTRDEEPERGMDLLVRFWEAARDNWNDDGIGTLNRALEAMGYTQRYRDIFKDFAVANYAKDLTSSNVPDKYKYADETQPPGSYRTVKLDLDAVLGPNDQVGPATSDVVAWGARYYQIRPTADVPILNVDFRQDTSSDVYYTLLAIKNGDIAREINYTGRDFVRSFPNYNYDKVVVIVAGLDNYANFRYAFNATQPVLNIVDPVQGRPAQAGGPNAPEKILVKVEVLSPLNGGTPVAGIDPSALSLTIGGQAVPPENLISSAYVQGQYWLLLQAPAQQAAGSYDLTARYTAALSDTEQAAVSYEPRANAANVLIIDRSGSMNEPSGFSYLTKLDAAKDAAALYVDSWRTGDQIGVVSYNEAATVDLSLRDWNETSRNEAYAAIYALQGGGNTSIGDGLIKGLNELIDRGDGNRPWALILLSDGIETADPRISTFMADFYNKRRNTGEKVPRVYVIALGPNADRARMEQLARDTGGTYHYASEPPSPPRTTGLNQESPQAAPAQAQVDPYRGLSEIYRVIGEAVALQQQVYSANGTLADGAPDMHTITVDSGASEAIFVFKGVALYGDPDAGLTLPPMASLRRPDGAIVSPSLVYDYGHIVWRVPAPMAGNWVMTVERPTDRNSTEEYLAEAAVKSTLTLDMFLGLVVEDRVVGRPMPILVSLSDSQPITGATVTAQITDPANAVRDLTLYDDGLHGDGTAGDGFYGNTFYQTFLEGSYVVVASAQGTSGRVGNFQRRLRASFNIDNASDHDQDGMPDWWETENGTNPDQADAQADPDQDGLPNGDEFRRSTNPLDPDTDDGGESDGSEVRRQADPLDSRDDTIAQPRARAWPGVGRVWVRFTVEPGYASLRIYRSLNANQGFSLLQDQVSPTGEWIDTTVTNGTEYCYRVVAVGRNGQESSASNTTCATPKLDPIPPSGWVRINDGAPSTLSRDVQLTLWANDNPDLEESRSPGSPLRPTDAQTSGVTQMMLSNDGSFTNPSWQPYQTRKTWQLAPQRGVATVYVKYRDAAGNESRPFHASIRVLDQTVYLPLMINQTSLQSAPDLIGSFALTPNKRDFNAGEPVRITAIITNTGTAASGPFYADFFINPSEPPVAANTIWNEVCGLQPCYGIAWYVKDGLGPGQSITLTSTPDSYSTGHTIWPGWFASGSTDLYLYVDSWNPRIPTGAVAESDEVNNPAELHGLIVTGANPRHADLTRATDLPPRPIPSDE